MESIFPVKQKPCICNYFGNVIKHSKKGGSNIGNIVTVLTQENVHSHLIGYHIADFCSGIRKKDASDIRLVTAMGLIRAFFDIRSTAFQYPV